MSELVFSKFDMVPGFTVIKKLHQLQQIKKLELGVTRFHRKPAEN